MDKDEVTPVVVVATSRRRVVTLHITRRRHRIIVAGGIVACGVVTICWPDASHISGSLGTVVNLVWLLVEPNQ